MTSTAYSVQQSVDTPNVTRFPSMVNNNHQNDHDHDHDDDNNNNIACARAYARRAQYERENQEAKEAYLDVFGRPMPRYVEKECQDMIDDLEIRWSLIREVIEYTACAPRPSWAYARAGIYRTRQQGIIDDAGFRKSLRKRGRDENPYAEERDEMY